MDDAGAITVPTQVLVSAADWVVQPGAQRRFYDALGSKVKSWHSYPGFFHDTFNERDNHLPIGEARAFILARFAQPLDETSLLDADRAGHTKAEYDALLRPLPALSPKALNFAATRLSMRTLGRASEGIRLGLATGFDSGATLDYVYRNEARGVSPIGRAIDRTYLDAIGWRGIRIRRQHVVEMLGAAIERVRAAGTPVHIVDIATGHGRYVLDALKAAGGEATALLRDYSAANVEAGRTLAHAEGRTGVQFAEGDAFDEAGLAALSPRPTIAVVSGLYELFPDNAPVRRSLAGLAASVPVGGYLVYTNQPWHPQVEMIARTLTSHRDGAPWIMRRRTQAEMDELVRTSGFEKIDQRTDEWGIFTVSMARRIQ